MQLGLGSYACAWAIGVKGHPPPAPMDTESFVRHAAALGLRLVQIADNLPLEKASDADLHAVRDTARSAGVTIELGTRGIAPAHIQHLLDLCGFFGATLLRVVVDTAEEHPEPAEVTETIRGLLPALQRAGVRLASENHDRFPARTLAQILERIGSSQVGVCLDTVNSLGCGEGPEQVVTQLVPYTISVHVKDYVIRRAAHMMGFVVAGTPAGDGALGIPWLLEKLRAANRDPNVLLELWPEPENRMEDTIRKEEQWRRSSVQYLRTLIPA
jgi:sugar phosphate isomerase/epimerase